MYAIRSYYGQRLTQPNLKWLYGLPEGPAVVDGAFAIAHGTPIDEDAYIFGEIEALNVFRQTEFPVCFRITSYNVCYTKLLRAIRA